MVVFIFIISTLCFALAGTYFVKKKYVVKRRIQQLITKNQTIVGEGVPKEKKHALQALIHSVKSLAKWIKTPEQKQIRLERDLESAGIPLKVEEFISIRLITFGLLFVVSLLLHLHIVMSILVALIGWGLPGFYLKKKKEDRLAASVAQLPQALETMTNGMKSGFSFLQSMQLVAKEMPDPIGLEFTKSIKEINFGLPLEVALNNLLERLPNKDLEIAVSAVLIQRSTGGNLVRILETIQETISERVKMKDELKALTAQGRISAFIITALPLVLGVLLNVMNPHYFDSMFAHPLGWVLLGTGVLSGLLGWIFIQKIVTIEV